MPVFALDPGQGLVEVDLRPGRRARGPLDQPLGDDPLGRVQALEEDAGLAPDRVGDDLLAPLEFLGDGRLDQGGIDLQELLGQA